VNATGQVKLREPESEEAALKYLSYIAADDFEELD
jgi:hypothetical protein